MCLSNELSCEAGSFSCHCNPQRFFTARGFEALFPHAETLGCVMSCTLVVPPSLSACKCGATQFTKHHLTCPVLQLPPCCGSFPPQLPISAPPTGLNECFFFNSLVVGLPYSSIFWQFWLFLVFKLLVILLLVLR